MDSMTAMFTIRPYNPVSVAIRVASPISLFCMAPASHVVIVDGDYGIEAGMIHGVRRAPISEILSSSKIVQKVNFEVPNANIGMEKLRLIAASNAKYDFKGAIGLGLAPGRNWQDPSAWFCSELFAYGLKIAGRPVFVNEARVTPYMLMCIDPKFEPQA